MLGRGSDGRRVRSGESEESRDSGGFDDGG